MELKIRIRQHIDTDPITGQTIYYSGNNPATLQKQLGALPTGRRWRNFNNYIDVTDKVSDLHQMSLTWTSEADTNGQTVPGGEFAKKSFSGALTFEDEAYTLIKQWLFTDQSAPLNSVDVQIEHVGCGIYDDYVIKAVDVEFCDNTVCQLNVSLKQKDDAFTCIQNTLITDNHKGWFPVDGKPQNKKHPRFSYCNEIRPNGLLITLWWTMMQISSILFIFVIAIAPIINSIIAVLIAVFTIVNAVIKFINALGGNINTLDDEIAKLKSYIITAKDIKDVFGQFFIESAGCGREHPAPLIRDYITNVCDKCGVKVTAQSAPLFFATSISVETSYERDKKQPIENKWNPYYYACYFNGVKQRGIRRFERIGIFNIQPNTTDFWINENAPFKTLDMLLDELKPLFNMDWRIKNNTLYIQRKDWWIDTDYVFDFSGSDKDLIIEGVCYNWTGKNLPAIAKGLYTGDGADVCGNEAQGHYDGTVSFGVNNLNPTFKGVLDKTTQFGAAKFRLDGASTDYILDAMQNITNTQFISVAPWAPGMIQTILDEYFIPYADYALLLRQETSVLPKVLIWDNQSFTNAKCFRPHSAYPISGATQPDVNFRYNNYPFAMPWHLKHFPKTFVSGSNLSIGSYPPGYYSVKTLFGATVVQRPAFLVNYPMYFEPGYRGTLWDWFHWIDDPVINPAQNRQWRLKMELCCNTLLRIKPFLNGKDIVLGQRVKLPNAGGYVEGKITEITINYDTSNELGMHIELTGTA